MILRINLILVLIIDKIKCKQAGGVHQIFKFTVFFRAFWPPRCSFTAYFEHFGGLGPDMARMGLRMLILSILAAWAQIWPKLAFQNIRVFSFKWPR